MEASRTARPQAGPAEATAEPVRPSSMPLETVQACGGCGATIAPVDQFYAEAGVRCPACHLEADEVTVQHDPVPWAVAKAAVFGTYPMFLTSLAYGALGTWLHGSALDQQSGHTMLVLVLLLGALGLAALRVGTRDLQDAWTGRIAEIQTHTERWIQGLSGVWMTLHGSTTVAMMAYLAWLVVEL